MLNEQYKNMLNAKNVIASPHSAALTKEASVRVQKLCLAVLRGEKWPYVADPKVYDHPLWQNRPFTPGIRDTGCP